MRHPTRSPTPRFALAAAIAALALAACGGGGGGGGVPGSGVVPVDPSRPGDSKFADGLGHYDLAIAAQSAAYSARLAGNVSLETSKYVEAVTEYGLARDIFAALRSDPALCPNVSIRCDNAAYLAGRCSYEIGTTQHDQAVLLNDPTYSTSAQASFQDAVTRLDAMLADFPASPFDDAAAYFDGRAVFQLTHLFGIGSYETAEKLFERSLALSPSGTWADNALYYDGRSEFELGVKLVIPLSPAPGTLGYDQARSWFDQAVAALRSLPTRFPTSSYRDNAAYHLGRSLFEKPFDAVDTASVTERIGNLGGAIDALGTVIADPASTLHPGAFYWRGRAEYARSTYANFPNDLASALADFRAVPSTSVYYDNALGYVVRTDVRQGNCAAACTDYAFLKGLFSTSTATSSAGNYLASNPAGAPCGATCLFPVP